MRGHIRSGSGGTGRTVSHDDYVAMVRRYVRERMTVEAMRARLVRAPRAVLDELRDELTAAGYGEALP